VNPNEKKDVRKSREDEAARQRGRDEFLRGVLSLRQGRDFFWSFLGDCGVGRNPFGSDPLLTAFACGELNAGQRVLAEILRVAPERYVEMMGEQNERHDRSTSDGANSDASGGGNPTES